VEYISGKEFPVDFLLRINAFLKGKSPVDIRKVSGEKRFSPRVRCLVDARLITPDKKEMNAVIVEVSLDGMRLYSNKRLIPEDRVMILQQKPEEASAEKIHCEGGPVTMRVVWSRKRSGEKQFVSGLQYADTKKNLQDSWVAEMLQLYGVSVGIASQKRKKVRISADLPISIALPLEMVSGQVLDLGVGGALISTSLDISKKDILGFRIGPYKSFETLFIDGKIAHQRYVASTKKWTFGIIFTGINEKQSHLLNSYLTYLITEESE